MRKGLEKGKEDRVKYLFLRTKTDSAVGTVVHGRDTSSSVESAVEIERSIDL